MTNQSESKVAPAWQLTLMKLGGFCALALAVSSVYSHFANGAEINWLMSVVNFILGIGLFGIVRQGGFRRSSEA